MPAPALLCRILETARLEKFRAVLLPDFYLDHLVRFPGFPGAMASFWHACEQQGGGVQPEGQLLRPGGNAANTAWALARLGVRAHLIARTSPVGIAILESTLEGDGVRVERVRDDGPLALTTAIECPDGSVMVSGPRGCPEIAPEHLATEDWDLIEEADAVLVANWANPRANDLAEAVFERATRAGARTYADTGDPDARSPQREERLRELISRGSLHALTLNALELIHYVPGSRRTSEGLLEAGKRMSRQIEGRVDLHATECIASFRRGDLLASAPRFRVHPLQTTGAGDTWNAGDILGDLLGLDDENRLILANALAGCYVASRSAEPPPLPELIEFLETAKPAAHAAEAA